MPLEKVVPRRNIEPLKSPGMKVAIVKFSILNKKRFEEGYDLCIDSEYQHLLNFVAVYLHIDMFTWYNFYSFRDTCDIEVRLTQ